MKFNITLLGIVKQFPAIGQALSFWIVRLKLKLQYKTISPKFEWKILPIDKTVLGNACRY